MTDEGLQISFHGFPAVLKRLCLRHPADMQPWKIGTMGVKFLAILFDYKADFQCYDLYGHRFAFFVFLTRIILAGIACHD